MSERKPDRYWTPENIDEAFDRLKAELGRVPTQDEFKKVCSGAVAAIYHEKYDLGVTTWNQYLEHRGEELNHSVERWKPEEVDKAFDELKERLGRVPASKEFDSGALKVIKNGKYCLEVRSWNQYLEHRKQGLNQEIWNPDKIDGVFDELKTELGRVPTSIEFRERFSGALEAISTGTYDPNIKSWNGYLEHRGEKLNHEMSKWTPENVDRAYDEMKERLGRGPTSMEFAGKNQNRGALKAIVDGRYSPEIKTWNEYLVHRGEKPNRIQRDKLSILENLLDEDNKDTQEAS